MQKFIMNRRFLPLEIRARFLLKLAPIELWKLFKCCSKYLKTEYITIIKMTSTFTWLLEDIHLHSEPNNTDFQEMLNCFITEEITYIKINVQPKYIQFIDFSAAVSLEILHLEKIELNRFIFSTQLLYTLVLNNVFIGDGYVLRHLLTKNKIINLSLKNLNITQIFDSTIFLQNNLLKLSMNKVFGLQYDMIIHNQKKTLQELVFTNMNVNIYHCSFSNSKYPNLVNITFDIYDETLNDNEVVTSYQNNIFENVYNFNIRFESVKALFFKLKLLLKFKKMKSITLQPILYNYKIKEECLSYLQNDDDKLKNLADDYKIDLKKLLRDIKNNISHTVYASFQTE